jgi:hypothetical protein
MAKKKAARKAAKTAGPKPEAATIKEVLCVPAMVKLILQTVVMGITRLVVNRFPEKAKRSMERKQRGLKDPRENRDPASDFAHSLYYLARGKDGKMLNVPAFNADERGKPCKEYEDWIKGLHKDPNVRFGFPVTGIKAAMASAANRFFGLHKVKVYGSVFIIGEPTIGDGLSPIECAEIIPTVPLGSVDLMTGVTGKSIKATKTALGVGKGQTVCFPPEMRTDMVRNAGIQRVADLRYRAEFVEWKMPLRIQYKEGQILPETIANLLQWAGDSVGVGEWRVEKGGDWGRFEVENVGAASRKPEAA